MKTLYHGGQKSGKSHLAEQKALELSGDTQPYYIATYDNSYGDKEMQTRIGKHQAQREERFITIEEPRDLTAVVKGGHTYLIDCMSMWILNTLEVAEETLLAEVETLCAKDAHIIFVLNDVGSGVIPLDATSRKYVDRSGIIGQKLAQLCDEVYEMKLGLEIVPNKFEIRTKKIKIALGTDDPGIHGTSLMMEYHILNHVISKKYGKRVAEKYLTTLADFGNYLFEKGKKG